MGVGLRDHSLGTTPLGVFNGRNFTKIGLVGSMSHQLSQRHISYN